MPTSTTATSKLSSCSNLAESSLFKQRVTAKTCRWPRQRCYKDLVAPADQDMVPRAPSPCKKSLAAWRSPAEWPVNNTRKPALPACFRGAMLSDLRRYVWQSLGRKTLQEQRTAVHVHKGSVRARETLAQQQRPSSPSSYLIIFDEEAIPYES